MTSYGPSKHAHSLPFQRNSWKTSGHFCLGYNAGQSAVVLIHMNFFNILDEKIMTVHSYSGLDCILPAVGATPNQQERYIMCVPPRWLFSEGDWVDGICSQVLGSTDVASFLFYNLRWFVRLFSWVIWLDRNSISTGIKPHFMLLWINWLKIYTLGAEGSLYFRH